MIGPGLSFTDTFILQSGQGRKYIDGRGDAFTVQLTAKDDLTLGDVTG